MWMVHFFSRLTQFCMLQKREPVLERGVELYSSVSSANIILWCRIECSMISERGCMYWAIQAGLLTPLTFARHRLTLSSLKTTTVVERIFPFIPENRRHKHSLPSSRPLQRFCLWNPHLPVTWSAGQFPLASVTGPGECFDKPHNA